MSLTNFSTLVHAIAQQCTSVDASTVPTDGDGLFPSDIPVAVTEAIARELVNYQTTECVSVEDVFSPRLVCFCEPCCCLKAIV